MSSVNVEVTASVHNPPQPPDDGVANVAPPTLAELLQAYRALGRLIVQTPEGEAVIRYALSESVGVGLANVARKTGSFAILVYVRPDDTVRFIVGPQRKDGISHAVNEAALTEAMENYLQMLAGKEALAERAAS